MHDANVLNIDVAPTIFDFAGIGIPDHMQGESWKPLLTGKKPKIRDAIPVRVFLQLHRYHRLRDPDLQSPHHAHHCGTQDRQGRSSSPIPGGTGSNFSIWWPILMNGTTWQVTLPTPVSWLRCRTPWIWKKSALDSVSRKKQRWCLMTALKYGENDSKD